MCRKSSPVNPNFSKISALDKSFSSISMKSSAKEKHISNFLPSFMCGFFSFSITFMFNTIYLTQLIRSYPSLFLSKRLKMLQFQERSVGYSYHQTVCCKHRYKDILSVFSTLSFSHLMFKNSFERNAKLIYLNSVFCHYLIFYSKILIVNSDDLFYDIAPVKFHSITFPFFR